jgi:hypothetical protein
MVQEGHVILYDGVAIVGIQVMRPEQGEATGHAERATAADDGELPPDRVRDGVPREHDESAAVEGPVRELEVHAEDKRRLAFPGREVQALRVPHHLGLPLGPLGEHVIGGVDGAEGHGVAVLGPVVGAASHEDGRRVLPAQGVVEEEVELGDLLATGKQFSGGVALEGDEGKEDGKEQSWSWSRHGVPFFL